jgi:acyl-CoA dehydrogenase
VVDRTFLDWPFFEPSHRALAADAAAWCEGLVVDEGDVDAACRRLVRSLGEAGWLRHVVPVEFGGVHTAIDVRSLCLLRETLARTSALADFAFAMQGLGSAPIALFGSAEQKRHYLPDVAAGRSIAAFAISEAHAGSDIAAMRTSARADGGDWVIDGTKTWISNAGIADFYVVFCRMPGAGERAWGAFVVDAANPGLQVTDRIETMAPHVLGSLRFAACRVAGSALIGNAGEGLRVALGTLDTFRSTVGAAALGLARRALDEAVRWAQTREAFGRPLAGHQLTKARLAEMALDVDASALLVYRAAWTRDHSQGRVTREAAMAKLFATEAAQRVVDGAVQLLGGRGVVRDSPVEKLYREVRALRIYEGTSEIQKLVIAGSILDRAQKEDA